MTEFKFVLTKNVVPKGVVVFKLKNAGSVSHDLKIDGKNSARIEPGARGTLRVTFTKAGKYPSAARFPGTPRPG